MAPQAAGVEVDHLLAAFGHGDFQAQIEIGADHDWQLTDEHQPVFRDIAQEADRFISDAVEYSQKIRQLMPLDPAVGEHAQYAQQGP